MDEKTNAGYHRWDRGFESRGPRQYPTEQVVRPIEFALQMMALDDCSGKHGHAAWGLTAKRGPTNAGLYR
jgi:hypothetical protein